MNMHELAAQLNGREYGDETTPELEAAAKEAGLVIVFGYSDDNVELRGAVDDEIGCYNGRKGIVVDREGVRSHWDDVDDEDEAAAYFERKNLPSVTFDAVWDKEGYSWIYRTDAAHATFDILEDGETFCRGIVFELPG